MLRLTRGAGDAPILTRRVAQLARGPRVMLVSEAPLLRLAIGRELTGGFALSHALGTASADRRLDAGVLPDALVMDLDSAERSAVPAFLVRLVERGFAGPRILVSAHLRPELAAAYSESCLTHFALARPWRPGSLRTLMESVLGVASPRAAMGGF
ncbi:hypothetical protein [Pyxidicoccus xibeiensis]|uniref:hypothetical protein n=1 Tax=Pyxidicoccus xibeiensis TaxID=2906759 RepID=UPI0020A704A5|nr:hypothetical protein [Pyxidicoccus xibeiensis]MCP3136479.1 hypothetical protein [Pyxidicoccus xibeiensis]